MDRSGYDKLTAGKWRKRYWFRIPGSDSFYLPLDRAHGLGIGKAEFGSGMRTGHCL